MDRLLHLRPWLALGIASATLAASGFVAFVVGTQPGTIQPNGLSIFGQLAIFGGVVVLAVSLIAVSSRYWRRPGWQAKLTAAVLVVLALPFALYGLLLFLAACGVVSFM